MLGTPEVVTLGVAGPVLGVDRLRPGAGRLVVHSHHAAVVDGRSSRHHDPAHVAAVAVHDQAADGVVDRAEVRAREVERHQVGLRAGRQSAQVVPAEGGGAPEGCRPVEVCDGSRGLERRPDGLGQDHAGVHRAHHVGGRGVGAHGHRDAVEQVGVQGLQHDAVASHRHRAEDHRRARPREPVQVLVTCGRHLAGVRRSDACGGRWSAVRGSRSRRGTRWGAWRACARSRPPPPWSARRAGGSATCPRRRLAWCAGAVRSSGSRFARAATRCARVRRRRRRSPARTGSPRQARAPRARRPRTRTTVPRRPPPAPTPGSSAPGRRAGRDVQPPRPPQRGRRSPPPTRCRPPRRSASPW